VTVIATDKTGTLTQGRMQADRVWTPAGEVQVSGSGYAPHGTFTTNDGSRVDPTAPPLGRLLLAAVLANDAHLLPPTSAGQAWEVAGDPTEGALLALAAKAGLDRDQLQTELPRVAEVPFDSARKRMTTIHRTHNGQLLVATKGAIETLAPLLAALAGHDGPRPITPADQARLHVQAEAYAAQGYRVLAVAGRQLPALPAQVEDAEAELVLYGLVAMADPPRPEAAQAVAAAQQAGIHPIMITGDHPATARAIAARLGILDGHQVLSGADLAQQGRGYLAEHVTDIAVYARTTPEQKLDIVEAWKARGQVVAMTGDGVNDAPPAPSRHRRGHGPGRHRGLQAGRRHGPGRRQLRHHRQGGARRPPHLRQPAPLRPLRAHRRLGRDLGHARSPPVRAAPGPVAGPDPVDQPGHPRPPRPGPGRGTSRTRHHGPATPPPQ